ncbi:DUF488 family protein [Actinokineospora sp. UTMC 2448]|uniref:DUF488 domain-containing protein n=1 Tax=Actinokineospora sp. UTMC 2448 TaxID=2268449 RepID=UPI00216498B0|nr:DUF488 domain-containing protein [Actinokineospora sp. UTMC 2448]UVS78697.1 hypothetical protein Actkin_02433 [Actinokineospora sp. UTMC 2448]
MSDAAILTIGHSTHRVETFVALLRKHGITAVADVRSTPFSRFTPQFNRGQIEQSLSESGIKYVFLGKELGARSEDAACYEDGRVHYARLAASDAFTNGIDRLRKGAGTERIAVMCAEAEPLDCHRTVLVARVLTDLDVPVDHVHGDGWIEPHDAAMERLMARFGLAEPDLFRTRGERMDEALRRQEERIAYVDETLRAERADLP